MKFLRFPKSIRLLKSAQFDRVMRRRLSASDDLIVVYVEQSEEQSTRLGLIVSRKCGNAIRRNWWKRCLREAFRLVQHELPTAVDLVVLPRQGAVPHVDRLKKSLLHLTGKLAQRLAKSDSQS